MTRLHPLPGRVLVEIRERYANVATTEQKYDTKTSGICVSVLDESNQYLLGNLVFWEEYKDGTLIERDGKRFAFIKIEDLSGYEDVEAN